MGKSIDGVCRYREKVVGILLISILSVKQHACSFVRSVVVRSLTTVDANEANGQPTEKKNGGGKRLRSHSLHTVVLCFI